MLISALCEYNQRRKENADETDKLPVGYGKQAVSFKVLLTPDGKIAEILDFREKIEIPQKNGKVKTVLKPREIPLPERTQKPGIDCNYIEHRPLYLFGLNYEKDHFTTEDRTSKAKKSHTAFVKHELEFFEGLDTPLCNAYRNFVQNWNPEEETENEHLLKIAKEYNSYYCFGLENEINSNLADDRAFQEKYIAEKQAKAQEQTDAECGTCAVYGENLPLARIHDNIKFPGGQSSGSVLVCMKEPAFESYGKLQSYNSSISERAMKDYTEALNFLLKDQKHHQRIDDMVLAYFAMKSDDAAECDEIAMFFGAEDNSPATEAALDATAKQAASGLTQNMQADENVLFYVVGMTPNSSRICQKFIYRDKFGKILDNLRQHQRDLQVAEKQREIKFPWIKRELISPNSSKETVPPPLIAGLMTAAFQGTNYPRALLETVVRRIKTDKDTDTNHFVQFNDTRIGICKACINRAARLAGKKEEITMALDLQNTNAAYRCGRLFAVLEKIQKDSVEGDLNRTIRDAYFSSACSRPAIVFPRLMQLSQNHQKKLSEQSQVYYQKLLGEIMSELDGQYPTLLSLEEQGKFIIGYYQQNRALYTKKEEN